MSRLENVDGLRIMGTSEVSVVAFASDKFNAYALMDAMHKRGWRLNSLQYPPS
jgi:glutamate/tyrosine decarboxylase-like PLP-dependent enzyme